MSSSESESSSIVELPFNSLNKCIPHQVITSFLQTYGVTDLPRDLSFYKKAMIHKSYCTRRNENAISGNQECPPDTLPLQEESNERLEFLGDSVLNMTVASYLFERYPADNEGFLTKMRTKLVNGKMLARLCKLVGLPEYILISKQIEDNNGRENLNILEDAFEAFIGAIYKDLGFENASSWIMGVIEYHLDFAELIVENHNFKDKFFKLFQQINGYLPKFYEMNVKSNFTNGSKTFVVCIKDNNGLVLGVGKGSNKKEAENDAAKNAMQKVSCV